ncbi:hypothetical protein GCM10022216_02500 [Sphingobacterium kyonggiense]|uniref:DUF4129 domain-containing protein n=1 Tax=Sphingobacterium kyonggiense TaxID=714075 RepID=A0ABP7Y7H8_9SPHI
MLQQFTWQQFLLVALLLAVAWYAVVILLYYRNGVKKLFSRQRQPEPLRREWDEEIGQPGEETLMGSTRQPEGVSSVAMDELRFSAKEEDPDAGRDIRLGEVPDVLEELKTIFRILEKEDGTKEDFISLFALVSARYPQIKGTPSQQALNGYIREHVLFPVSDEELDRLWE